MLDVILIISQALLIGSILYFIFNHDKKEREKEKDTSLIFSQTISNVLQFITDENKKMFEMVAKIQVENFKNLEKSSGKQLQTLDKAIKELTKEPKIVENKFVPQPIDIEKTENTISKPDTEEIPLMDSPRIPIVDGVKIKFEDEEEIFQPNITSFDNEGIAS